VNLYATPAISIIKPAGVPSSDPAVAYVGLDKQFVRVDVSNKGKDVANATVTVWACGFGTSSGPHGYAVTLGGVLGTPASVEIPAGATFPNTFVTVPWKPQAGELGGGTELHCCLRANVFVDPADVEPDPALPTDTPPSIDIFGNIRHAQRNMTLYPKPPGFEFEVDLAIGNPDLEEEGEFSFEVVEILGKFDGNELWHLGRTSWIDRQFTRDLMLADTKGELKLRPAPGRTKDLGLKLGKKSGKKVKSKLKGGEDGTVRLQFDPGEEGAAEVRRFDVVQRRGKREVGRARVMTLAVPEELLERSKAQKEY
jgi:hypothetical protein